MKLVTNLYFLLVLFDIQCLGRVTTGAQGHPNLFAGSPYSLCAGRYTLSLSSCHKQVLNGANSTAIHHSCRPNLVYTPFPVRHPATTWSGSMHATCRFAGDPPGLLYWCIDMVETRVFTLLQVCVGRTVV